VKAVERIPQDRPVVCVGCGHAVTSHAFQHGCEGWWSNGSEFACDEEGCQRILAERTPRQKARRPRKPLSDGGPVRILVPR
jgi:hypothetical protein